ncbi:MAG TPA: tetratricopeptide repeat protein [Ferruginibacter sp.]|nr:tetratricopeptide repeat protein [Ferruginibacter sp.]
MKKIKSMLFLLVAVLAVNFGKAQSIEEGKKFLYYEKYISAKNVFQQLVSANPGNADAAYWLGQTLIAPDEDKDIAAAKEVYRKALAANSNNPLLIAGMGHIELLEGKTQDARNRFETAISLSQGKNIAVLNAVGFANGDFDSKLGDAGYAVEKLKQATNLKGGAKDAELLSNLGDAYRKLGDGGSAQRTYEAALAADSKYARAMYRIGRIYQTQGPSQQELTIKYYNDAIALDPNYTRAYWTLHQLLYESDVVRSAAYLDKYLAAKGSDELNACFLKAQMKFAQGLFAEAITASEACIAGNPNPYPNLYGLKAYSSYKMGDSVNAKSAFDLYFQKQKPAKIGPRDYSTYAEVLLKFPGNEALAGTYIEKAVEADSTEAGKVAFLKSVAVSYEKRNMYNEAADWYKKILAIKKMPSKTDLYNAGYGYYRVSNFPPAIEIFNLYTQKYPDDIFGYYMMGKSLWGIDTVMAMGLANPSFEKAIQVGEAYTDKSKIIPHLMGSYKYMIAYAANIEKNKELALSYADKALLIDATDKEVIANREAIGKSALKPGPKSFPKAQSVSVGADGSITTTGNDGSSTVITKGGKITTIKDGVTTIIENGKVTTIGKDGKVVTVPAGSKIPAQKPGTPKKK